MLESDFVVSSKCDVLVLIAILEAKEIAGVRLSPHPGVEFNFGY